MPVTAPARRLAAVLAIAPGALTPSHAGADHCRGLGLCFAVPPAACPACGGTPLPGQSGCAPFPCGGTGPFGGCCTSFGCAVGEAASCAGIGGTYQGDGTGCTPDPCGTVSGACCTPTAGCQ